MSKSKSVYKLVLINLAVTILSLLVVEGLSSIVVAFAKAVYVDRIPAERRHTQYDEELGWINLPNVYVKDIYGPGKSLKTNSMTFRNNNETSKRVPPGKIRIICSGDSYTMGYGVDNDSTWCQLLESSHPNLETVNLGLGGYGIDQTYLWFKRNAPKLDYNLQIFAFISDDFDRMQGPTYSGYGKPLLVLEHGALVNKNRPVPTFSFRFPLSVNLLREIDTLNLVKILRGISTRMYSQEGDESLRETRTHDVVLKIFDEDNQINRTNGSVAVFVLLPDSRDYTGSALSERWRKFLSAQATEHKFLFVDLIDDVRMVAPDKMKALFSDNGHFSEDGNRFAATTLYNRLVAIPEIQAIFQQQRPSS